MSAAGVRAVFLVGFMGSGKNTVGQELARRLAWDFVDLDACTEARERQSVPEIFRLRGEQGFRVAETGALSDLLTNCLERNTVVALGGGAFVQESNRELLRCWPTVFLDAPAEEQWRRCRKQEAESGVERPLRRDPEQFARLLAERLPFYRQAFLIVDTSAKEVAAICLEIEQALQLREVPDARRAKLSPEQTEKIPAEDRATPKSSFKES